MVASQRKYRYRKFQRTRTAADSREEAAVGVAGMDDVDVAALEMKRKFDKTLLGFGFAAWEWQGHKNPLLPVSVEVGEDKVQVSGGSGSVLRCFSLDSQDHLDVLVSDTRQRRAALLKGSKEYDLVSSRQGNGRVVSVRVLPQTSPCSLSARPRCFFLTMRPDERRSSSICARVGLTLA